MITYIEDEFYRIIEPIIQNPNDVINTDDFILDINLVSSRDKINIINNLKLYIKTNLFNPSLSIVFSKYIAIIFSQILFQSLDDRDQNVRIASDECINQIIRLTSNDYSRFLIYNLFLQLKNNKSSRSIVGAISKFSSLVHLIKHNKRSIYIKKLLPVLKILIGRQDDSILLCLLESLPPIAKSLFPFSDDSDIESLLISPIQNQLKASITVSQQRSLSQLLSTCCLFTKDYRSHITRIFKYCISSHFHDDQHREYFLHVVKSLLTVCQKQIDCSNFDEIIILVFIRTLESIENRSTASNENLSLDSLSRLLHFKSCSKFSNFVKSVPSDCTYFDRLKSINNDQDPKESKSITIFETWKGSTAEYLVALLIERFLPDCIFEDLSQRKKVMVNSKVLAINCLSQLSSICCDSLLSKQSSLDGSWQLPPAIDCVLFHFNDEDSQLHGSVVLFLGQVIGSQLSVSDRDSPNEIDYLAFVDKIQSQIDSPKSGQHAKFALSALRLFLWDLVASKDGRLVTSLVESVFQYSGHSYKLVRKEVVSVFRSLDFRSLRFFEDQTATPWLVKKMSLTNKSINAFLLLLTDHEPEVREEACQSLNDLIAHGLFDDPHSCDRTYIYPSDNTFEMDISQRSLIPFLSSDFNVTLSDIRRKIQERSEIWTQRNQGAVHRCLHIIIERILANPVPSSKEMKESLNNISGLVAALVRLMKTHPLSTHPQLWVHEPSERGTHSSSDDTWDLLGYCTSLLSSPVVMIDIPLHSNVLHLVSRLFLHVKIKNLLQNGESSTYSEELSDLNTETPFSISLHDFFVHLSRMLNVFWHVFRMTTPPLPPPKTFLSSQVSVNFPNKKDTSLPSSKGSAESLDATNPLSQSCTGFFANLPHYMLVYNGMVVAYNSYLISSDSPNYSDKFLSLLSEILESWSLVLEILTFNDISPLIEELLAYCSIFYNVLPIPTVEVLVKLLGSVFGTNLSAQWSPFLTKVYSFLSDDERTSAFPHDISQLQIQQWRNSMLHNQRIQVSRKNSSNPSDALQLSDDLSESFSWVNSSSQRHVPAILKRSTLTNTRPRIDISHYIFLFERNVFQCMSHYVVSSMDLQRSIIQLIRQLSYVRVNYYQLDSEQKFLKLVLAQLQTLASSDVVDESKDSLIIEMIEFLILISYEKMGVDCPDQPMVTMAQVVQSVGSLLLSNVNVVAVVIPCMQKVVIDLFIHRPLWLNNLPQYHLVPNPDTKKEIETLREEVLNLLLNKLLKWPQTFELMELIVEHSIRVSEADWRRVSTKIWSKVSSMLCEDGLEVTCPGHVESLLRLIRAMPSDVIVSQAGNCNLLEKVFQPDRVVITDEVSLQVKYTQLLHQAIRVTIFLYILVLHKFDFWRYCKSLTNEIDEPSNRKNFFGRVLRLLPSLIEFHNLLDKVTCFNADAPSKVLVLMMIKVILLILIDGNQNEIFFHSTPEDFFGGLSDTQMSYIHYCFQQLHQNHWDLLLLWHELQLSSHLQPLPEIKAESLIVQDIFACNKVSQICRYFLKEDRVRLGKSVCSLISQTFVTLIRCSNNVNIQRILKFINMDEKLSADFLKAFDLHSKEIALATSTMMRSLSIVEQLNNSCSERMILFLNGYLLCNCHDVRMVVAMKIEMIICSRLMIMYDQDPQMSQHVSNIIISLDDLISTISLPLPRLSAILKNLKEKITITNQVISNVQTPFEHIYSSQILEPKSFWKMCLQSLLNRDEPNSRLCTKMLQGGSESDLEELFGLSIKSSEEMVLDDVQLQMKNKSKQLLTLPSRCIQQCLRLGFLRSGGGVVQEGIRVDHIFRFGENLMFQELVNVVNATEYCLMNGDSTILRSPGVVGILSALNDYLCLSRQLSMPVPISQVDQGRIFSLIENLCVLIMKSRKISSRISVEEILHLITSSSSCFVQVMDEENKSHEDHPEGSYVSVVLDFLYMVVGQFPEHLSSRSSGNPSRRSFPPTEVTATSMKVDRLLSYCLLDPLSGDEVGFHYKLKSAVIIILKLPSLMRFTRGLNHLEAADVQEVKDGAIDLDCLTKMSIDELSSAESLFGSIALTSKFMFEETWFMHLNLLHNIGPSGPGTAISDGEAMSSAEEVVEQAHCHSIGLLGLTSILLRTTGRPLLCNHALVQLDHRPRNKTPSFLYTKMGRKLSSIYEHLEEEIFHHHRGRRWVFSGLSELSWNIEREGSLFQYRHDQIDVNVLAKRTTIGSRSPQIGGSDSSKVDVLSCLQSLPVIYEQWLHVDSTRTSAGLWPRVCALRTYVILMDLFTLREQIQCLFDCLLELSKAVKIEDDWITLSWLCIGLSKCVSALPPCSTESIPRTISKSQPIVTISSIYGLLPTIKIIETCLHSDLLILQQSALHSAMFLLNLTINGKSSWDLPVGSLAEVHNLHLQTIKYLEEQLVLINNMLLQNRRNISYIDVSNDGDTFATSSLSTGATSLTNTIPALSVTSVGFHPPSTSSHSSWPLLMGSRKGVHIRSERHDHLILAASSYYCETFHPALVESDLLNHLIAVTSIFMEAGKEVWRSSTTLLILCRCLERCLLTQRMATSDIDRISKMCSNYLESCTSYPHLLPVIKLHVTTCFLSPQDLVKGSSSLACVVTDNWTLKNDNPLETFDKIDVLWKILIDPYKVEGFEPRILSRMIAGIITEFISSETVLNKTLDEILKIWPRVEHFAQILFDIITRCVHQPRGESIIRRWTLEVLPNIVGRRPANMAVWVSTIVMIACSSQTSMRSIFGLCLDWLPLFAADEMYTKDMEECLLSASASFLDDLALHQNEANENITAFFNAMRANIDVPTFEIVYNSFEKRNFV